MPPIIYCTVFLLLINFYIEPTTCAMPAYIQNLELDDITSLWDKFPIIIDKIKEAVNRFRCPKGWRRLGGSCYYLSNTTSTPTEANHTCNLLHSNHSNLMQIRNTVELFYAAHVLTKNNLPSLMIDIDPNLLKGKHIAEILMDDQGRWRRMKDKFTVLRDKYYKLKEKVLDQLDQAGLRISRRSKKIKHTVKKHKQKLIGDDNEEQQQQQQQNISNSTISNTTIEEYEYDDLDSIDDADEFESIEDIKGICDQIGWNVIHNDSTIYLLTTYLEADNIVCSLSNVEPDIEYEHACEYVLDFCFANIVCGEHGRCVNTLSGFKCSCSFLYGGLLCERVSKQGQQIIIGLVLIFFIYGLSFKPIRWVLIKIVRAMSKCCSQCLKVYKHNRKIKKLKRKDDKLKLVSGNRGDENDHKTTKDENLEIPIVVQERRQTLHEQIMNFISPRNIDPLQNPNKRDLVRLCWVGGLSVFFLSILFIVTTVTHFTSFKYDITDETKLEVLANDTIRLVAQCEKIADYRMGNLIFFPFALTLILIFSWSVKRENLCLSVCDGRPGLIPPIEPFRTANRFTTATVFGILAFEVLKIFEEVAFSTADPSHHGVLIDLVQGIAVVILVGLRYYPVLASLQLRNVVPRFFISLYMLGDIAYTIVREGSCMGFLPLSKYYSAVEEAKLRMELGTWFIIYGLIKNTPHFIFLAYIGAELWVRFVYDSIYVPLRKNQSIWISPVAQPDEFEFSKYYVKKLFRRNLALAQINYSKKKVNIDELDDHEHEAEVQKEASKTRVKDFIRSIYTWDEDFRFTTMATCTYAVAIVFLYYLACTFVFLYISRTTGHFAFLRFYLESMLNIEIKGLFSLKLEIIMSAIITVIIYACQLFVGMKNYKLHRKDLYKGIYENIPSPANFKPNSIASKSVHYSGFLVGYMAWGFVICFHLILFILTLIRFISLQMRYIEVVLAITVPVLVIYLLKMGSISTAGKFLFIQDMDEKLNLKNRKTYAIFLYFNFFADCFLGMASCVIRLIKATFLNVVYMARLDCSFLGRPLEKFDIGFAAYVSYLHMEVTHTNPIMLAFCYSLYDDVIKRRPNQCYDDECCIAPGELGDDVVDVRAKVNVSPPTIKRNTNGTSSKKTKVPSQKIVSPSKSKLERQISVVDQDDDDDEQGLSIRDITPKKKSPSSSISSNRNSQKSKQRKSSVDNNIDKEQKDDGNHSSPDISAIARLIPQHQPTLPPPSAPVPEPPPRSDLPPKEYIDDDDDDFDDDGGIKPSSYSTISKIMPPEMPRLLPMQQSSPPRVPKREDVSDEDDDDDEDDDGGLNPKTIAKQKQELEDRKKKKNEAKIKKPSHRIDEDDDEEEISKSKQSVKPKQDKPQKTSTKPQKIHDDEDDDDGGIPIQQIQAQKKKQELEAKKKEEERRKAKIKQGQKDDDEDDDGGVSKQKQIATALKKKQELEAKKKQEEQRKAKIKQEQNEDEDDDGGISKQKLIAAAQKKKQESEAKKKEKEQHKVKEVQDNDEDDDGAPKRQEPTKKKQSPKKVSKPEILKEEDEDDDGGRIVKTYDTVRMMMPNKQPVLDKQVKKQSSPEALDDGSMLTSVREQKPLLASYDTVGRMVPKVSTGFKPTREDNHYDTIPTDEERTAQLTAIYSPPSYDQASNSSDVTSLRTISYRQAQHSTPPLTQRRLGGSSSIRSHSNTNDDSSHYSEINNDTAQSGIINRSYSHAGSIRSSSNHSIQPQSKQSSQYTLKEEQPTEESTVETDEDDDDDDDDDEEEEEEDDEEDDEDEESDIPLQAKKVATPYISTAYNTVGHLVNREEAIRQEKIRKQKQARFRWFLAYTIINNYHLFDLRKQAQSRLALLRIQRSNLIDEQQQQQQQPAASSPQPVVLADVPESLSARQRTRRAAPIPTTEQRPPPTRRLLSVPTPVIPVTDNFPESPAERYIAIRSCMLYDCNGQHTNNTSRSHAPSAINQPPPMTSNNDVSTRSTGFVVPPNVLVQAPSDASDRSGGPPPLYLRQASHHSTPSIIHPTTGTPLFQGVQDSRGSTADYPLENGSSNTNFSTLRTQMSHAQHMQVWRQNQLKRIQKKRPHCYVYGPPPQRALEEKVATAAILTPQILESETSGSQRLPSKPKFEYPRQVNIVNETRTNNQRKQTKQDDAIQKKSLRTSTAIDRRDSPSNVSNVTEV
ncbi:unnamed protein product [Adineta steineri]|uniref:Receptor for retinol uptake STRA6 n=2 Tax=Adineta steineri TaxID=433720 RepID=A0A815FN61_9BILA|nr:unnamed protein product [Adineta steineri]